uniref:hypothetical protein n=1 Tax=Okeania sp. SIO2F4 TaxID=2607790 RepID=UPI0025DF7B83|nr:hypothetical protein [Okeania sp. SIO2F4]
MEDRRYTRGGWWCIVIVERVWEVWEVWGVWEEITNFIFPTPYSLLPTPYSLKPTNFVPHAFWKLLYI